MSRRNLIITAGVLLVVLAGLIIWLASAANTGFQIPGLTPSAPGTNPALDIRYSYNPNIFEPAPYEQRSEYPLQLNADGWSLHGKRIKGLGTILDRSPAPILYDFVASQHAEMYENQYLLERVAEEYEDATIQGRLSVHCTWSYRKTAESPELPYYMSDAVRAGNMLESEGWAVFTDKDLFFFYTFAPRPLTDRERRSVLNILQSMEFNALGLLPEPPVAEEPADEDTPFVVPEDDQGTEPEPDSGE